MFKKAVRFFALVLLINAATALPTLAGQTLSLNPDNRLIGLTISGITSAVNTGLFSVKAGQPYDQATDPALMKSGPAD